MGVATILSYFHHATLALDHGNLVVVVGFIPMSNCKIALLVTETPMKLAGITNLCARFGVTCSLLSLRIDHDIVAEGPLATQHSTYPD